MSDKQLHALVTALQSAMVACAVFLPAYAGVFTAVAGFLPSAGTALLGLLKSAPKA